MSAIKSIKLSNGALTPILGCGTWLSTEDEPEPAIDCALETGYRHIDTAYVYRNEHVIGKLPNIGNRESHVEKFLDLSLSKLQLDYVDLYLIHTPFGFNYKDDETTIPLKPDKTADFDYSTDLKAIWKKMEEMDMKIRVLRVEDIYGGLEKHPENPFVDS